MACIETELKPICIKAQPNICNSGFGPKIAVAFLKQNEIQKLNLLLQIQLAQNRHLKPTNVEIMTDSQAKNSFVVYLRNYVDRPEQYRARAAAGGCWITLCKQNDYTGEGHIKWQYHIGLIYDQSYVLKNYNIDNFWRCFQ